MRLTTRVVAAVLAVFALTSAGCSPPQPPRPSETPIRPVGTFSTEDTMKQVVDPARDIVKVAALQDVSAGFDYDGPLPGKNPFGTVIHTDTVMAVIGQNPVAREDGYVHVFGECRNMDNHRDDATTNVNVTAQLRN